MKWALLEKIELVTQSIEVGFTVCNIFKWGLCAGKGPLSVQIACFLKLQVSHFCRLVEIG
jgi:hypothetical protein